MKQYLELLRHPNAKVLLLVAFPARIAYGMIALATFFKAEQATGSIAIAGLAIGFESLSSALTAGLRGALMDRWGQKWPLRIFVPGYAILILALNFSHDRNSILFFAFVLGLSAPPINLSIRPLWQSVVPSHLLRTAYALDTAVISAAMVLGPVIATALALSEHPGSALITCSVLIFIGGTSLGFTKVSRAWRPEKKDSTESGTFKSPAMQLLMLEGCIIGFGWGAFDVAVPAFATLENVASRTAWILGTLGVCNIAGGLIGGLISKRVTPLVTMSRTYILWFIASVPLAFTYPGWSLALAAAFLGLTGGSLQVFYWEVMEAVRPRGTATSSLGWLWTAEGTFMALGAAVGGWISNQYSPRYALGITTVTLAIGWFVLQTGKSRLFAANKLPSEEQDLLAMKDNTRPAI